LIVDGHNSHYTRGFLEYARENRIHVLCYPSHSTHLYQGLDVVIFSVLKRCWSDARDSFERKHGQKVTKTNFLSVYAQAHLKALTEENILAAFRKTGIVPFNPDMITDQMMAPSATSSTRGNLPLPMESPVRVMNDMIHRYLARQSDDYEMADSLGDEEDLPGSVNQITPIRAAIDDLASTSASFLVSHSLPQSTMSIPLFRPDTISPFKSRYADLLGREPVTQMERELQDALAQSEAQDERRKHQMVGMQATTMLHAMYASKVQGYLQAHKENKKAKRSRKKIVGNGMPRLFDADEFYNTVVEAEEESQRQAVEKEERRHRREQHGEALVAWKKEEDERKRRNDERRQEHQAAVKVWETERDQAKLEKRRTGWTKPKLTGIEKPVPRPKKPTNEEDDDEEDDDDDDDEMIE
jgi:hypothetical protein